MNNEKIRNNDISTSLNKHLPIIVTKKRQWNQVAGACKPKAIKVKAIKKPPFNKSGTKNCPPAIVIKQEKLKKETLQKYYK